MILKILLLIAVVAAVYFFFFKTKPAVKKSTGQADKKTTEPEKGEETVECAACGAYVALDDAIVSNGKYYCSKECLNS